MKKVHICSLKFHTIYSVGLALVFLVTLLVVRDLMFGLAFALLLAYVIGNGIIHGKKNEITRDGIIEYIIVSAIAGVLLLGILLTR